MAKRKKRQPKYRLDGHMLAGQRRESWIVVGPRNRNPTLFLSAICATERDRDWFDEQVGIILETMNAAEQN